jgi:thiamine-phosphate pyrophosphorylase
MSGRSANKPVKPKSADSSIYRILDANLNRLREALRVIEEYYRFISVCPAMAVKFKLMRHAIREIESSLGKGRLLSARDILTDPLASKTRPEELNRSSVKDVLCANFKRAQEASRVIEEYSKAGGFDNASAEAKKIRFKIYASEKKVLNDG